MSFNLVVVFLCLGSVLARIDEIGKEEYDEYYEEVLNSMEEANYTREWFNCDGDNEDGYEKSMDEINKCLKQFDTNENLKEITKKCFPGMYFPTKVQDAREWHCNKSVEEIAESIKCETAVFKEMDSEEAILLIESLLSCHWGPQEDEEIECDEEEDNEYDDENKNEDNNN